MNERDFRLEIVAILLRCKVRHLKIELGQNKWKRKTAFVLIICELIIWKT